MESLALLAEGVGDKIPFGRSTPTNVSPVATAQLTACWKNLPSSVCTRTRYADIAEFVLAFWPAAIRY